MKTYSFKAAFLAALIALTSGCANNRGWTDERLSSLTNQCAIEYGAAASSPEAARSFCQCYYGKVKAKHHYDDYVKNIDAIDQQMFRDGEANSCETP